MDSWGQELRRKSQLATWLKLRTSQDQMIFDSSFPPPWLLVTFHQLTLIRNLRIWRTWNSQSNFVEHETWRQEFDQCLLFSSDSPAALSIRVSVSIQGAIKSIESLTHQVEILDMPLIEGKANWTRKCVELLGVTIDDMDRDFVLLVTPEDYHVPCLYSEVTIKLYSQGLFIFLLNFRKLVIRRPSWLTSF